MDMCLSVFKFAHFGLNVGFPKKDLAGRRRHRWRWDQLSFWKFAAHTPWDAHSGPNAVIFYIVISSNVIWRVYILAYVWPHAWESRTLAVKLQDEWLHEFGTPMQDSLLNVHFSVSLKKHACLVVTGWCMAGFYWRAGQGLGCSFSSKAFLLTCFCML